MDIKSVLLELNKIQNDLYKPITNYYQKKIYFEYASYGRSAIKEIKKYLIEHKDESPISALEDFRHQMDCFACNTKDGNTNFMFSIYYDVATTVLDMFLSKEWR